MAGTKLLPCPFCGGEAQVARTAAGYWAAYCEEPMCGRVGNFKTEAEAIEAWNSRAPMSYEDLKILLDELGVSERTCRNIDDEFPFFKCSECRCYAVVGYGNSGDGLPNYCPNCGARVIGANE